MNNPTVVERFSEFYDNWICKLQEILKQLLHVFNQHHLLAEHDLQSLVSKVTTHLKEYYTVKWSLAREDIVIFFSPPWLTPLEKAYLWITGWKPSTAFKVLESLKKSNLFEMTEEQERKIEGLRMRMRMEEEKVEREMERQQVGMADSKIVKLAKRSGRATWKKNNNGEDYDKLVQLAMKDVFGGLERIMKASDCARLKTLKGILDVLQPMQCVHFLTANITIQLRLKQWGNNCQLIHDSHAGSMQESNHKI
ncbi:protein DOG1-like 4 [Arachis stenosperma]|uniref:protein DOG1-like 4 n=1 Tax=Arachis stenosperma TaxID=217475 RepID=UPI0025AC4D74|nr:protein DOG1-like 4 [Arachis stenosperma]